MDPKIKKNREKQDSKKKVKKGGKKKLRKIERKKWRKFGTDVKISRKTGKKKNALKHQDQWTRKWRKGGKRERNGYKIQGKSPKTEKAEKNSLKIENN